MKHTISMRKISFRYTEKWDVLRPFVKVDQNKLKSNFKWIKNGKLYAVRNRIPSNGSNSLIHQFESNLKTLNLRFLIHLELFNLLFLIHFTSESNFAPFSQSSQKAWFYLFQPSYPQKMKWIKIISISNNRPIRNRNFSENPT